MSTALKQLREQGVSVWLDDLSRELIDSGQLQRLIDDGVLGITTNPTIFASALAKGDAYEEQVRELVAGGVSLEEAVFAITTSDVQHACDLLAPVYADTQHLDGRVSLEVDPRMARDAAGTIASARALWAAVDRPNLYIKIPATVEGLEAITTVLGEGISVNVTLIFSLQRYRAVADAFLAGLEQAQAGGHDVTTIASVASFFVSRVDAEVDKRLNALGDGQAGAGAGGGEEAKGLTSQAGLANARLAYQAYEEVFAGPRWLALAEAGAKPQRPLWASTGVKDPALPDTLYVTELVAPGTVNTMPGKTLAATIEHADIAGETIRGRYQAAQDLFDRLARLGISYDEVVEQLETEGLQKFEASWGELLDTVQGELTRVAAEVAGKAAR